MRLFKKLIKSNNTTMHCEEVKDNLDFDGIIKLMEERLYKLENGEINNPNDFPVDSDRYQFVAKWRDVQIERLKQQIAEAKQAQMENRSI